MRLMVLTVLCLAACASEKLGQAPPPGVDFSGRWQLNAADSDDPQRLIQAKIPAAGQSSPTSSGRGGRQTGGRGGAAGTNLGGPGGPVMPSVGVLSEGLRWP